MRLTLDESKDNDKVFEITGITCVIDKYLLKKIAPISIDFEIRDGMSGFVVSGSA
ncbi:hypothetical protein DSCA_40440 [Desulfosarcina alkanivorans]|uniref:Uncharacterized protein n=1 Tax=Desulfosarcina alkanivorans TaxID=571177 RepID=A0A5K7YUY1_9BACT|nr:hypothetical protein DSCA_40440 [Desulfosarcina alkanivorans]